MNILSEEHKNEAKSLQIELLAVLLKGVGYGSSYFGLPGFSSLFFQASFLRQLWKMLFR